MITSFILAAFLAGSFASVATAALPPPYLAERRPEDGKHLDVPSGTRPTLDGTIRGSEWKAAIRRPLANGGRVWFLLNDDRLYVGVRGTDAGWSHLIIEDGKHVRVLHVSNALGDVAYEKTEGGDWKLKGAFQWEMSGSIEASRFRELLEKYLSTHGWTATNNNMGRPSDIEFEIDLGVLKHPKRLRLVVVHSTNDGSVPLSVWPPKVNDDATRRKMINGYPPDKAKLKPSEWGVLKLSAKKGGAAATSHKAKQKNTKSNTSRTDASLHS